MNELWGLEFMRLAAVTMIAAAVALGVLGVYVVLKRVVFVGLALANLATLGAATALVLAWPLHLTAIATALLGATALALASTPRRIPTESLVGWIFAAASAGTVLVLSRSSSDADAIRLLFGNVLAITRLEAWLLILIAAGVVALHAVFAKRFVLVVFDPETARAAGISTAGWTLLLYLTIGGTTAAAVHETGALLAFAFLTLPAMSALLLTRGLKAAFLTAAVVAALAALGGLVVSFFSDLPTGPFTVALLAALVPIAHLLARLRRRHRHA